MGKCYVLGAGFSNAVAGLPLTSELVPAFRRILRAETQTDPNGNRVRWGKELFAFLDELGTRRFTNALGRGANIESGGFEDNLEAVTSFIDLNISTRVHPVILDDNGAERDVVADYPFWGGPSLKQIRQNLATYIHLALTQPPVVNSDPLGRFAGQLENGDSILTFNYDVVLDGELWKREIWNPADGYGIQFSNLHELGGFSPTSCLPILKLHGSLNWKLWPGAPFASELELDPRYDDQTLMFPGPPFDRSGSHDFEYRGAHDASCWMMPSFVKSFEPPELLTIWRKAAKALGLADEIVFIGYSLPKADSAASVLLAVGASGRPVTVVDPQHEELDGRIGEVCGDSSPMLGFASLSDFLER
ncbi:MAG: hypothetical protein ACE5GX_19175 [Thermoanaerobaculia bacterium]